MAKYTLSEYDIKVLIGVSANKACDEKPSPFISDAAIMTIGAEIAKSLLNHLSGVDPFPENVIEASKECLKDCGVEPTEADGIRIMGDQEFDKLYELIKSEFEHIEPGDDKRVRLIGAVEGAGMLGAAFTGAQLRKIFNLGFRKAGEEI